MLEVIQLIFSEKKRGSYYNMYHLSETAGTRLNLVRGYIKECKKNHQNMDMRVAFNYLTGPSKHLPTQEPFFYDQKTMLCNKTILTSKVRMEDVKGQPINIYFTGIIYINSDTFERVDNYTTTIRNVIDPGKTSHVIRGAKRCAERVTNIA